MSRARANGQLGHGQLIVPVPKGWWRPILHPGPICEDLDSGKDFPCQPVMGMRLSGPRMIIIVQLKERSIMGFLLQAGPNVRYNVSSLGYFLSRLNEIKKKKLNKGTKVGLKGRLR